MALQRLRSALRPLTSSASRTFSTTPSRLASVLFALSSLSNSRETQHFAKLTRLTRIEHSPPLKLIKTSEVDPFPLPSPPPPAPANPLGRSSFNSSASAQRVWDLKALNAGRAVLADQARHNQRLRRALERSKRREASQEARAIRDRQAWQHEARRLRNEMRVAGVWILLSIGTATALATWRFWPGAQTPRMDSGELGRRIAERARSAMPLPAVARISAGEVEGAGLAAAAVQMVSAAPAPAVEPGLASLAVVGGAGVKSAEGPRWWQGWFWKQQ